MCGVISSENELLFMKDGLSINLKKYDADTPGVLDDSTRQNTDHQN